MTEYIEGKRPVIEALRAHVPMDRILIADNLKRDGLVQDIERKAKAADVPVVKASRRKLDEMSDHGSHQGIIALASQYPYAGIGEILAHAAKDAQRRDGRALIVALDHITDAGNLGAIVRSAEVVGASGLIIPNKRSAQVSAATYKSSAGAIAGIPVAQVANLGKAFDRMKEEGFWVAGASEHAEQSIWESNLKGKICLVMGNEGEGLARLTAEKCDFLTGLPQVGNIASLNVAQSATACMYEWLRQNTTAR